MIDVEAILLRELHRQWRHLNHLHLKDALAPPVLQLGDASGRLGCWTRGTRTLEISRSMVERQPWSVVIEVLRHEMAHQYVDEVLRVTDEAAHGPAFRRTCDAMGADPAARGLPEAAPGAHDRVLGRVQRLLALAESPNQHEAQAAMNAAHRLMLKHNLGLVDAGETPRFGVRHLGEPRTRVPAHEKVLAGILTGHFFVEGIWIGTLLPQSGRRGRVLEVCGTPENLDIASYVHEFLLRTAERLWGEHKRARRVRGDAERRRFLRGVMTGFWEQLRDQKRACEEEGLVWLGDPALAGFLRRRHPLQQRSKTTRAPATSAWQEGRAAGRRIVLHRGLAEEPANRGRLLEGG